MAEPSKKTSTDNSDILAEVQRNFESAFDSSIDSRAQAERRRDYFDGKQWTAEEKAVLKARKQPCITDNALKDKIEFLVGMEANSRTDPKAYPRTPQDEDGSEAATDALRYVAENNDLDTIVSDVAENIFIEGMGGCEVLIKPKQNDVEIVIVRNRWDRMYHDPHSMRADFSDARFWGTHVWMDEDDAKERWPKVDWSAINESMRNATASDTQDDVPKYRYYDHLRKRVQVIEQWYYKGSKLYTCKFVKGAFIEKPTETPYQMDGEPDSPRCWMSGYVDRDGNRYGIAERYMDLQDEINQRRSKALHLLNTRQVIAEDGAVKDVSIARKEVQKPDGYVEIAPNTKFEIQQNNDLAQGQWQLLQDARMALATTTPNAQDGASSASGRSKLIDQQQDVLEIGRQFDKLRALKREIYRKIWARVQQYWTEQKWVRIRDEEGNAKFAQLNEPYIDEFGMTRVRNNVSQMDVDIILDDSPDIINLQQEQFELMVQLAQAGVPFPPDSLIMASNLRNKEQILEKLTGGDDPQAQAQLQQQQQIQMQGVMLQMAELQAKIENLQADTAKKAAEAEQTQIENAAGGAALVRLG